jgi:hypothetical protein
MATDTRVTVRMEKDLIEQARQASGLTAAPLAQLIRAALMTLARQPDPYAGSALRRGPKAKPRT